MLRGVVVFVGLLILAMGLRWYAGFDITSRNEANVEFLVGVLIGSALLGYVSNEG